MLVHLGKNKLCPAQDAGISRGNESKRREYDFIAGLDIQHQTRHIKR